ncbi:MAG: iron-containing alcohol dehydrogenase [Desulfovibrio sp.]|jgi:alcohol dehydrogenase class IV|nr:iron-containing alcohol dehydrogenase [Desulfovibrio sp.]
MQFMFTMPTLARFGRGAGDGLAPLLLENGVKRVFLVSDPGVLGAGILDAPLRAMKEAGLEVERFVETLPNAPDYQVESAAAAARGFRPDAIVSIGGGSCIDTAKAVNILLSNPGPISLYDGVNLVPAPGRLHVAVPTTAGTSSECTVVAVISDEKNAKKMVIFGKNVAPAFALIDPAFTDKLPPHLTAYTGMDALTHALEAYISLAASSATDAVAPEAVALIAANLPRAYADGTDAEARDNIMLGCQLAGICFSNTGLGLVHSLAQPMGGRCHVPHGLANAVCLPHVLAFTLPAVPDHKIVRMAHALGLETRDKKVPALIPDIRLHLEQLARALRIPSILEAGVSREAIPAMSEDALKELSTPTAPRKVSAQEVASLYEDLFTQAAADR